ncbi:MAG: flagellar biosynthetic protein FliO [Lachnospiraceae bacterium]|nr:flagellar biosynthetic protein FliO [Lachnospiraceae bacterium]
MAGAFWNPVVLTRVNSLGKSIAELVLLVFIFVLILAACVVTTRFVAGRQMQRGRNSNFKPLETCQVAPNRYLQLIQIGTRYFVISVTKESISLITEMKAEEIVIKEDNGTGVSKSFKAILSEFKAKVDKHEDAGK